MKKKNKKNDLSCLLGKHFVSFLRHFGAPEHSVIMYENWLGYEMRSWYLNGRAHIFVFNPNNRCISVDVDDFFRKNF